MRFTSSPSNQGSQAPPNFYAQPQVNQQHAVHGTAYGASQYTQFASPGQSQPPQQPIDLGQWGVNPVTAQFGMQLGQSAVAAGQEYMQKNVSLVPSI